MILLVILAVISVMIFFNALYVAAEFATVSSRRSRINQLAGQGNNLALRLAPIINDSHKLDNYVATCQIGITISSLVLGTYGTRVMAPLLEEPINRLLDTLLPFFSSLGLSGNAVSTGLAVTIAALLVLALNTTLQVIMGELFPKSVAIQFPERLAMAVVVPMQISQILFTPLIWFFNGSGRFALHLLGRDMVGEGAHFHSPEEIELLMTESHQNEMLTDEERRMLRNAFRLRELTARQVMLHRTKLVAAPETSTVLEILDLSLEHGFSRIPIYGESVDDVKGFVHVKDVFRLHVQGETAIKSVVRKPLYVPETMPVVDVWEKLNKGEQYMAIVFDEYGGTAGLLTFEDLIEEVFGELQDEFDDEMALISRDKDGRVYLRGDLLVVDVNEYLELQLPEDHDTLSGLVLSELGRRAKIGDKVSVGKTILRVEALADPGVSEVSITLPPMEVSEDSFIEWEVIDHD